MKTTANTVTALERFADALGWTLERDGRNFALQIPGTEVDGPPPAKSSAEMLALGVSCVRYTDDWPEIRELVAYDPGWLRVRKGQHLYTLPKLPRNLKAAWMEWELTCLCAPYTPE